MKPRVSVLIPCYNAGRYLAEALDSVLAQTYRDFEIIVVDDGSTDDSAAVAARYPQVRYFHHAHSGISVTRNLCLSKAEGEFVVFLDADDLWMPDKLEKQVAYLDRHPDCQLVFTKAANFFEGQEGVMNFRQRQLFDTALENCIITCVFRRSVFETWGIFRTDYPYGEDTQFMFRLLAAGISLEHCLPDVLYRRRVHDNNISLTHEKVKRKDVLGIMADAFHEVKSRNKG